MQAAGVKTRSSNRAPSCHAEEGNNLILPHSFMMLYAFDGWGVRWTPGDHMGVAIDVSTKLLQDCLSIVQKMVKHQVYVNKFGSLCTVQVWW